MVRTQSAGRQKGICLKREIPSVRGTFINSSFRLLDHVYSAFEGKSISYGFLYDQRQPYKFGKWDPPEGYTNEKVLLAHCQAFILKKDGSDSKRVIYQVHGGGYVAAFRNDYNRAAVHFSKVCSDADVFSVDYRTAPEFKYPCALTDAYDGYLHLLSKGYRANNIAIAGDSAGGGLAVALCMYIRDRAEAHMPSMLMLSSPWTDLASEGESYKKNIRRDAIFGTANPELSTKYFVPMVYAHENQLHDPYVSPAYGDFSGFPPMLIQTGGDEMLLSDSKTIAAKAKEKGCDARLFVYPGMYHTFYMVTPGIKESKEAWKRIEDFYSEITKAVL